jgi:hypothetical protein
MSRALLLLVCCLFSPLGVESFYQFENFQMLVQSRQFLNFCKMIKLGKSTTIAGDINIDYLKGENSDIFAHFCAAGCGPIIDQPTTISEKSASCIDHIFTSMRNVMGFVLECDVLTTMQ